MIDRSDICDGSFVIWQVYGAAVTDQLDQYKGVLKKRYYRQVRFAISYLIEFYHLCYQSIYCR